jgi:hypothetical protein
MMHETDEAAVALAVSHGERFERRAESRRGRRFSQQSAYLNESATRELWRLFQRPEPRRSGRPTAAPKLDRPKSYHA